jgi:hypothetical protein
MENKEELISLGVLEDLITELKEKKEKYRFLPYIYILGPLFFILYIYLFEGRSLSYSIYLMAITITTVGYGDTTPNSYLGMASAPLIGLLGLFLPVIAIYFYEINSEIRKLENKMEKGDINKLKEHLSLKKKED